MTLLRTISVVLPSSIAVGVALYFPSYGVYKSTSKIEELIESVKKQDHFQEVGQGFLLSPPVRQTSKQINLKAIINRTEKKYGIPPKLMLAISTVESTLRPWAVYARPGGKPTSKFFKTKEEAVEYIKSLKEEGRTNINVGSMQINLQTHEDKFQSLEHALDPAVNIDYAGYMLKSLYKRFGTWEMAVRYYHTSKEEYHMPYQERVWNIWGRLRNQ